MRPLLRLWQMGRLGSACCRRIMAACRLWKRILVESQLVDVRFACTWAELGIEEIVSLSFFIFFEFKKF